MAIANRKIFDLIPLRDFRQIFLILRYLTQHGVDKSCCLSAPGQLRQLHRGLNCRAVRHSIQKQNLIGPQPQNFCQRLLKMVRLLGAIGRQIKIQQELILHYAIDHAAAKRRIRAHQTVAVQLGLQCGVRPCVIVPASGQDPQGRFSCSHQSRLRLLLRPRKIRTYRKSCRADISSAAT